MQQLFTKLLNFFNAIRNIILQLSEIKVAEFGAKILELEKELLKKIISEAVEFVESEEYIKVAEKVGRIK